MTKIKSKKHILILPSWYSNSYNQLSGIFFKEQAEALVKYGYDVGVISIQEFDVRNILKQKKIAFSSKKSIDNGVLTLSVEYHKVPKYPKINLKIKEAIFQRIFKKYIKNNGLPDIVHLHSYMVGEFAVWIKEKYNIPYVVTEHFSGFARNTISLKDLDRAKVVFEKSDYNIAVSKQFKDLLQNKFNSDFNYVPNIVNIDFFNIKETNKKDTYDFINIAYLDKNKNQDMLIRAFSNIFKNKPKVNLNILGDGSEYSNLDSLIKELNMENQISLYGRVNRDEVKTLLQKSDAFVLSSQYETFGIVLIEAMACGLPVVATKCGGPETIIGSDEVGLLSEIDEIELSKKLNELYENKFNYDKKYIRKYVEDRFSEKVVIKQLENIYTLLVQGFIE